MGEVNNMKRVKLRVENDNIYIGCDRKDVLPAYLAYMFEYMKIDFKGKTIHFNDCTCKLIKEGVTSKWA